VAVGDALEDRRRVRHRQTDGTFQDVDAVVGGVGGGRHLTRILLKETKLLTPSQLDEDIGKKNNLGSVDFVSFEHE
jgi:hypothetical protein